MFFFLCVFVCACVCAREREGEKERWKKRQSSQTGFALSAICLGPTRPSLDWKMPNKFSFYLNPHHTTMNAHTPKKIIQNIYEDIYEYFIQLLGCFSIHTVLKPGSTSNFS